MMIAILVSFLFPSLLLINKLKKNPNLEKPEKWGLLSGLLPMGVAALWDAYFIIRYHGGYGFNEMQWMEGFNLVLFLMVPILAPICANLIWKRASGPLMKKRLLLYLGFLVLYVLYFNLPLTWDFSFVLFPVSLILMTIAFCFLRRKRVEPTADAGKG